MSTRILYNRETQQLEKVPEAEITQRVASGKYTFQQKGIEIPVVAPDGATTTISSDEAEQGFRDMGYRWLSQEEGKLRTDQAIEQDRKEIFGKMEVVAGAAGVARSATFGLSDLIAKSVGLEKDMETLRKENPKATLTGELVGAFAPIPGAVGKAATSLAGKALQGIPEATSVIGKISRSAAEMGLGSVIEGAAQGIGQGITEASLGDPNKVVENMFFNTTLGAGMGGVIGGLFGGVGKAGSIAVKAGTEKLGEILPVAAKEIADKTITPGLRLFGRGDASDNFQELLRDPDLTKIFDPATNKAIEQLKEESLVAFAGLKSDFKAAKNEVTTKLGVAVNDEKAVVNQLRDQYQEAVRQGRAKVLTITQETETAYQKALKTAQVDLKQVSKQTEKLIKGAIEQNAGDMLGAMRTVENLIKKEQEEFKTALLGMTKPARGVSSKALDNVENTVKILGEKIGTQQSKVVANDLLSDVYTQFGSEIAELTDKGQRLAAIKKQMTEGEEALFLRTIRQKIDAKLPYKNPNKIDDILTRQAYLPLYELRSQIDGLLKSHPNSEIANMFQTFDKRYAKYKSAETVFDKFARTRSVDISEEGYTVVSIEDRLSKAVRNVMSPEVGPKFDKALANIDDLFPHLGVLSNPAATAEIKMGELQVLQDKVQTILGNTALKSDVHAITDALLSIAPEKAGMAKDLLDKATKRDAVQNLNFKTTAQKLNALGQDSSQITGLQEQIRNKNRSIKEFIADKTIPIEQKLAALRGDSEVTGRLAKLREAMAQKDLPNLSPLDKFLAVKEVLSGTKDDALAELAKLDKKIRQAGQLSFQAGGPSAGTGVLPGVTAGGVATAIAGPLVGISVGLAVHGVQNPLSVLRGIANIERFSNRGAALVNDLSQGALKTLTSPLVARASNYVSTRVAKELFLKQSEALADFQDPNRATERVAKITESLGDAPQVQQALSNQILKAGQFLYAKMPKQEQGLSLTPQAHTWEPDPGEVIEFQRYVNAVTNPASVLENVASGTVTPQEVEVLQQLYPSTFDKLKQDIVQHAATLRQTLPYERRVMLSTILGVPVDNTLTNDFVTYMQQNVVPQQRAKQQSSMQQDQSLQRPGKAPNLSVNEGTQTSRISE